MTIQGMVNVKSMTPMAETLVSAGSGLRLKNSLLSTALPAVPPEAIPTARNASISTVGVQIRAIYAKPGVHHLSELTAQINALR